MRRAYYRKALTHRRIFQKELTATPNRKAVITKEKPETKQTATPNRKAVIKTHIQTLPTIEEEKGGGDVKEINFGGEYAGAKNNKRKPKKKDEEINCDFGDLKITKIETNKDGLYQRFLMKHNIIPKHPSVSLLLGSIGSGKTTLLINLLKKAQYYGKSKEGQEDGVARPYFDATFLLTGSDDDMYEELIDNGLIKEQHIKFDPKPEDIALILSKQQEAIKEKGLLKAPKVLIILEDIIDNKKLMGSPELRSIFIKPRQNNLSIMLLSQYINLIPKALRQQGINLFIFTQNRAGNEIIAEQFCPANMNKKDFLKLIQQCTESRPDDTHPFLHINRRAKLKERFRRNLDTIIKI